MAVGGCWRMLKNIAGKGIVGLAVCLAVGWFNASLALSAPERRAEYAPLRLVSQRADGGGGNGDSLAAVSSADGSLTAFQSRADDFSDEDHNLAADIYLTTLDGTPRLISRGQNDQAADGESRRPDMAANGCCLAFESVASNMVSGDTNQTWDIFLFDLGAGALQLISRGFDGPANGPSSEPALSADGRFVIFESKASNLTPGDTNGVADIFAFDRRMQTITLLTQGLDGAPANHASANPAVSADGRYVVFDSWADNLVKSDTNRTLDVFWLDRRSGDLRRVSQAADGSEADRPSQRPALTADGDLVAFESLATNLTPGDVNDVADVFVYVIGSDAVERVSVSSIGEAANDTSGTARLSADGRFVVFASFADNLTPGDGNYSLDVFVHDRQTGITQNISSRPGVNANGASNNPSISADGRYIAFDSVAANLIPGDDNAAIDIFLFDRALAQTFQPRLFLPVITVH